MRVGSDLVKDLLNVVVGAGIPGYFTNCISSIARLCPHDTLAIYNFVDDRDLQRIELLTSERKHPNLSLIFRPNETIARTGSLYDAYNHAIEYALSDYRYISFIQADMQMMWWDEKIVDHCDAAREKFRGMHGGELCFYTQIPVRGKRVDFYSNWGQSGHRPMRANPGAVDVAIYPVVETFGDGFRFAGSEREFSAKASRRGISTALHPFPFLAPIPFPQTVRTQAHRARAKEIADMPGAILKVLPAAGHQINFERDSFHPLFMEDLVVPDGWSCLTPYWPSDTSGIEWFRVRWQLAKKNHTSIFSSVGAESGRNLRFFEPGPWQLMRSAIGFFLREVQIKLRSWKQ